MLEVCGQLRHGCTSFRSRRVKEQDGDLSRTHSAAAIEPHPQESSPPPTVPQNPRSLPPAGWGPVEGGEGGVRGR